MNLQKDTKSIAISITMTLSGTSGTSYQRMEAIKIICV